MDSEKFIGIKTDMSNEDYHSHPAFSSSDIKLCSRSMAHFKAYAIDRAEKKESDALDFGTCAHEAILEGKSTKFICGPEVTSRATKEWKEYVKANEDKIVLLPKEYNKVMAMFNRAMSNENVQQLLSHAKVEQSYFAEIEGLYVKARPDALVELPDSVMIIDYKTATNADYRSFQRAIADYAYDVSAVHYIAVVEKVLQKPVQAFVWIAQEKTPPYELAVYAMTEKAMYSARGRYFKYLNKIKAAFESGVWEGYQDEIQDMDLPEWLYKQEGINDDVSLGGIEL